MSERIRFQPTPNPNAGKFIVEGGLPDASRRSYESAEAAAGDPLAMAVLGVSGVASVFMVGDFVTVTKDPGAAWEELRPRVLEALSQVLEGP